MKKKFVSKSKNLLDKPIPDLGGRAGRGVKMAPPQYEGEPLSQNPPFPTTYAARDPFDNPISNKLPVTGPTITYREENNFAIIAFVLPP